MKLRPYQQSAVDAIRHDWTNGILDTLAVMATGAGKTNVFLSLLMDDLDADPAARGLCLAHRKTLIDQPLQRIGKIDPEWALRDAQLRPRVGVVMAERDDCDRQLTIGTIQTLGSTPRLERLLAHGPITHLVTDECHRAVSQSYLKVYEALKAAYPGLKHLGVTATPIRGDGAGLAKVYQSCSAKVSIADLVRDAYLVQPRWLGISTGISIKGIASSGGDFVQSQLAKAFDTPTGRAIVLASYQKYASGRRAIAFTASVAGAHELAAAFNEAGIRAAAVDGTTPNSERDRLFADFRAGVITVLCNCYVLVEGFDAPGTNCILMCRPTRSDLAYIQAMGRGLRPAIGMAQPGEDCLILDFLPAETRNIVMAGDVLGLPKHVVRTMLEEKEDDDDEPGEVQAGFTFDGEHFNSSGTPLEIIARQLDYLQVSPFHWHRRDGWMTLGLGAGSDQVERILAMSPTDGRLHGIYRYGRLEGDKMAWGPWQSGVVAEGDFDTLGELAAEKAARWGNPTLSSKDRSWHQQPISEGQEKFLRRLASRDELGKVERLSKGDAAALVTHYVARQVLRRAGVWV